MKILVLSDLHAVLVDEVDTHEHSRLIVDDDGSGEFGDGLIGYIQSIDSKLDYIICCGDIANRGQSRSFVAGWKFLNRLSFSFPGSKLICVPGNHDHQSRPDTTEDPTGFSPKHQLQFCEPSFPFDCFQKNTHFWAWNWAIDSLADCNVLSLNTSAYHGYSDEYKHGRVSSETINQICDFIESDEYVPKPINILVCHHHPQRMEHAYEDYDGEQMSGGQSLVNALQEIDVGPWLVIHGHKHFACVSSTFSQAQTPPIVFSAGSTSAKLYEGIKDKTSNQIYLLDIDISKTDQKERVVGKFKTYEYTMANGWLPSKSENLPANSGFGSSKTAIDLISDIKSKLVDEPFLQEIDLIEINEELGYFTPREFVRLKTRIEKHNLIAEIDESHQKIIEIGYGNAH
ncbi:MAG: metallophosphoesterase [Gammaproteobacteria bacterium]|nr:metallophosphoesterase [Gammaproteobacteria bacterium]